MGVSGAEHCWLGAQSKVADDVGVVDLVVPAAGELAQERLRAAWKNAVAGSGSDP